MADWGEKGIWGSQKIPEELSPLLKGLDKLDRVKKEELSRFHRRGEFLYPPFPRRRMHPVLTGERILENLWEYEILLFDEEREGYRIQGKRINVIPGHGRAKCEDTLLVLIGTLESLELMLLRAVEVACVLCKGITRYVVIYTAKWNTLIWERHRGCFEKENIVVVKREMFSPPIRLC